MYYEGHYNSLNPFYLIIFNIIWPGRLITRIKYRRVRIGLKKNNLSNRLYSDKEKNNLYCTALESLSNNGAVVLENYFSEEKLSMFEHKYNNYFNYEKLSETNLSSWLSELLPISKIYMDLWTDDLLLNIIKGYIGRMPYARNYPRIQYVNPQDKDGEIVNDEAFASSWHIDHATLIQFAIYLTDVYEDGSCMQFVSGSHKYPNVAHTLYSNEYIEYHKLKKKKCFGQRGSVQIHCGNLIHRFKAKGNSPRAWLKFEFCSGNNILFDLQSAFKTMSGEFNIDNLTEKQRSVIYPLSPYKGYELVGDYITPTKYKGV